MKLVPFLLFILFFSTTGLAQNNIVTKPVYKHVANFDFTNEWQYLSTDLYLLNTDKFERLINEVAGSKTKKRKFWQKATSEHIQYLFITAQLDDLDFFGGNLEYPIYNFKVTRGEKSYRTQISLQNEVVQLIEDLPLAAVKNNIEAKIEGVAITGKNTNKFFNMIARQLQTISKIQNPSLAVLELVGEFGKFIESKTADKQYEFSSTIRLYESTDFNKHLHSINVYAMLPSSQIPFELQSEELTFLLDSVENPVVSQQILRKKINYTDYPIIIVANYKSRYILERVVGDKMDDKAIKKRQLRNEQAFKNKLIDSETFDQEDELIIFLKAFMELKTKINHYHLNYDYKIAEALSTNLYSIAQQFRKLKNLYIERQSRYYANSLFLNQFQSQYEAILQTAEGYLDDDHNLKNIKDIVNIVYLYENNGLHQLDSARSENYLHKLYSIRFPDEKLQTEMAARTNEAIEAIEKKHYQATYSYSVTALQQTPANEQSLARKKELSESISATNCKLCRENVKASIADFDKRYESTQLVEAQKEHQTIKRKAFDHVYEMTKNVNCMDTNINRQYGSSLPPHIQLLNDEFILLKSYVKQLQSLMNSPIEGENSSEIRELNTDIEQLINRSKTSYTNICNKEPSFCKCE